jgi:AcrR family transcriptional regulator
MARLSPVDQAAADGTGSFNDDTSANTRDRIKAVAAELYVPRGHDGFSFGDIARAIGTTRANIHHHFGSKRQLTEELIEDFAANAEARTERYLTEGNAGFFERLDLQLDDVRRFYERFNKTSGNRNVRSPLSLHPRLQRQPFRSCHHTFYPGLRINDLHSRHS